VVISFLHSHSFTGNPLGCAAALATLDLFSASDVLARNRELADIMRENTEELSEHPHIGDVRQHGMILAMEMVRDRVNQEPFPWQERRGLKVYKYALTQGVIMRPLGNVVYLMPPYVISTDELRHVVDVAKAGINLAVKD